MTAAVERVVAEHGRVDVCVQSAALIAFGEFLDVPAEVFDRVVTTNVLGTANVARAVLPGMRERDDGVLVVVGSVLGRISVPQLITYCTSKWAVRGLTRMLSQSVRDRSGVRVVGVVARRDQHAGLRPGGQRHRARRAPAGAGRPAARRSLAPCCARPTPGAGARSRSGWRTR